MFSRYSNSPSASVTVSVGGSPCCARVGDSVAAALLALGIAAFRAAPVSGSARAPYCMMGVCFDCLVMIDGVPDQQACLVPVEEGMRIELCRSGRRPRDE